MVQYRNDYTPYYDREIKEKISECDSILTRAIQSHGKDDWREYRHKKTLLDKQIKIVKTKYIKHKMTEKHKNWKFLNTYNKQQKCNPPDKLLFNQVVKYSPREIANIANNFFISKVENIRRLFTESIVTPLEILRELIPRVEEDFSIEPITIKQTIKIIDSLKNSNSTGHDDINNRLLKKCKYRIAPHLTHLINTILSTK